MMSLFEAIVLGVIQGVTEFLPVSSSAHLLLFRSWFSIGDVPLLFDIYLHLATIAVIVFTFRKRILSLLGSLLRLFSAPIKEQDKENLMMILSLLLATVMTVIVVFILRYFDLEVRNVKHASALLLVSALIVGSMKWAPSRHSGVYLKNSALIGVAQGLGSLTGISRLGITVSSARHLGIKESEAAEFSLLLSVIAVVGALVLTLSDSSSQSMQVGTASIVAGMVSAFIVGLGVIQLFIRLVKSKKLYLFSFYLFVIGLLGVFTTV